MSLQGMDYQPGSAVDPQGHRGCGQMRSDESRH